MCDDRVKLHSNPFCSLKIQDSTLNYTLGVYLLHVSPRDKCDFDPLILKIPVYIYS